ncbi:hypothetical protein HG263_18395 [Pseudoalteromonas sp. JBTF-M23]|uniref:Serine dehydrogenase proteinase n=1 Tax=Pseudoalteromonas caenipelagi TaxID=2726988 RepID=A0A849VGR9_9GAMM|nr:hypothetical protein [Pseudoalteromonas caenipelagi]NOU52486.1 hypothetical protein [Pseudoalteromonas caenipelagi]
MTIHNASLHAQLKAAQVRFYPPINDTLQGSKVITLAASHIDMSILPTLNRHLKSTPKSDKLALLLYTRGGDVNAARRIALLLRHYCNHLSIIAPYCCQSSGTLLALSADVIYYTPLSVFSAFDPHLEGGDEGNIVSLSSADVKLFKDMAHEWFNLDIAEQSNMLGMLCEHIFPPTLTSFYRTVCEVKKIASEHLTLANIVCPTTKDEILNSLLLGSYSHDYAISGEQLNTLGINCIQNNYIEDNTLPFVEIFELHLGAGNRESLDAPWCDSVIMSPTLLSTRYKKPSGLNPQWSTELLE